MGGRYRRFSPAYDVKLPGQGESGEDVLSQTSQAGKLTHTMYKSWGGDSGSSWTGCVNSIFLKDSFRRYSIC